MRATIPTRDADLLAELRRPFPAEAAEQKGTHWYVSVHAVLDCLNEVLGFDWDFTADSIEHRPLTLRRADGSEYEGHEAVVSGHLGARYRDEDGAWQTLRRSGSDSCQMVGVGDAIKGATSGAIVKAASTLGVGRELYGKDAPRRKELDLIRLTLLRWIEKAQSEHELTREGGLSSLRKQLRDEALAWREATGAPHRDADLAREFRRAHGFAPEGELTAAQMAALIVEAVECRRGVRPYPELDQSGCTDEGRVAA